MEDARRYEIAGVDDADRRGAACRSELNIRLEASLGYDERVAGGGAGDKRFR